MAAKYSSEESLVCSTNNICDLQDLLTKGYDCNEIATENGLSLFHMVVADECQDFAIQGAQLCLHHGGNPNLRSLDGLTPTHLCAAWGRKDIFELLLNNGGDPYIKDVYGLDSHAYAMKEGHLDILVTISNFELNRASRNDRDIQLNKYDLVKEWCDKYVSPTAHTSATDRSNLGKSVNEKSTDTYRTSHNFSTKLEDSSDKYLSSIMSDDKTKSNDYLSCKSSTQNSNLTIEKSVFDQNLIITGIEPINSELYTSIKSEISSLDSQDNLSECHKPHVNTLLESHDKHLLESNNIVSKDDISIITNDDDLSISEIWNDPNSVLNTNITMRRHYPQYEQEMECSLLINAFIHQPNDNLSLSSSLPSSSSSSTSTSSSCSQEISEKDLISLKPLMHCSNQFQSSTLEDIDKPNASKISTADSYVAIAEEKKFLVDDLGVELVERRYLVTPCIPQSDTDETKSNISTECSTVKSVDYDTDSLRKELKILGINPGPITNTTKIVYIKKLLELKRHPERLPKNNAKIVYSLELEKTLKNNDWTQDLKKYINLDNGLSKQFSTVNPNTNWRGGNQKASFTYLLLDPRITNNLPARVNITTVTDSWPTFIESIFYVGKGIRSRPYAHLYQAVHYWNKTNDSKKHLNDKKVRRIVDIWEAGLGVVCLNVFQHVIPAEAFTREAAMIDALNIKNLTNIKSGEYYGLATGWSAKDKRNLGVYLLYRAMNIFLNEGERQIHPADIK